MTTAQMNGDVKESPALNSPGGIEGGEKVVLGGAFSKFISTPKQPEQAPKTPRTARYLNYLKLLTVRIIDVYRRANTGFEYFPSFNPRRVLTHPSEGVSNQSYDNSNSDYIVYVNDIIGTAQNHRYHVLDLLGQGTFGQVVKCQNCDTDDLVALKILKNKPAYLNQGLVETRILEMLNNHFDPENKYHTVRLLDFFMFRRHLCLVFELLSVNLYELIKQNHFRGLSTNLIRVFMIQMLEALTILSQSNIIHCDLKPENVLLYNLNSPTIKLIDFGSACFENQTVYSYIQSRHYRSPEVLVGHPYTAAIDMWSLGCIAAELYLGLPLFPGTSEFNQLCRIVEMQGPPPDDMLERSKQASKFFNKNPNPPSGQSPYTIKTEQEFERDTGTATPPSKKYFNYTTLEDIIQNYAYKKNMTREEVEKEKLNRRSFCNFVQGLLQIDPKNRWTPVQAKTHPFITGDTYTGPFTPEPAAPKAPPNPRSSPAGSLGFYPPNLQNFPPIPPPIAPNGTVPQPMNGAPPHVPSLPPQPSAKKPPPVPQVPMLPNLSMLKQQEFNQSPADNYSPRGYFAHVMQQQHPAQLLGASPSTHHFQSPQHYMYGGHHQQHYMGASPNMSYNPMWQDFSGGNYPRSNRARSKSEANYGGPPIPQQQLLLMQQQQQMQHMQLQQTPQQHPPIPQHLQHVGAQDGAQPDGPPPATPPTPSQQQPQVSPRRRSHSQSHPTNPSNLYLGESPRVTPGVLKDTAPPFYPRDMAITHNLPSPSTNAGGGGGGSGGNAPRGRNTQHQNPSNNSGNRSRSKSFGDTQHHGQHQLYPAQSYQQQYPYQSPHMVLQSPQHIPEMPVQASPHIPQLPLPPHPTQHIVPQLPLHSLPHHQSHLQSPQMPQLLQSPHQPSPHQASPHQYNTSQQSPRQTNSQPHSPRQQPPSPHQPPQSPTPHQQYNNQQQYNNKHYQQKHAYVQAQGQRTPSSPRGTRHQQPNSPRGKPPLQSPDTPLSPSMEANSNSTWDPDDSLLFQFDPPTPTKPQNKKQHTPQQQTPQQPQQPQQAWRRKSPEGKEGYSSNNAPPNYHSHHENRRSGGNWNKIPLGESFTSPAPISSSPYVPPYDPSSRDTSNLLGFSPYQNVAQFSHSPPERERGERGGRGSKNYGQLPFSHSPPERKGGGGGGGGGKSQPLGNTPNMQQNRFTQQSPPKPITGGGKKYNTPSSAGTTPTASSPNPRSPSGFAIRSPPTSHTNNNNNNNNNNSHKSPRQNTLYSPAQAVSSISTPNMQQKPPHWNNGPRRSNSFYNKPYYQQQQPQQQMQQQQQSYPNSSNPNLAFSPRSGEGGEGEGFMFFPTDEDGISPPSYSSEPLPDTFSPYSARHQPPNTPNTSLSYTNIINTSVSSGGDKSLPEVPDTT